MALLSGAEDGAQTRDPQLGRLVLYQLSYFRIVFFPTFWWAQMDSNHRRRKPADLQSAPFGHSGICPVCLSLQEALVGLDILAPDGSCRIRYPRFVGLGTTLVGLNILAPAAGRLSSLHLHLPSESKLSLSNSDKFLSLLSDSNQRPRDYKSRALAN